MRRTRHGRIAWSSCATDESSTRRAPPPMASSRSRQPEMSALRAVGRVAWRDITRHRGRSLLVVLLIALPVAAMVAGIALLRTTEPSQERRDAEQFGRADLIAQGVSRAELDPYLPTGSIVEPMFSSDAQLLVDGSRPWVTVRGLVLDGLAQGMLTLLEGRPPKG